MILLDTNVVSELMRRSPDPAVEAWVMGHAVEALFFSAVGEAELRYGAAILPAGRRRDTLTSDIEAMLHDAFENRILPFDSDAARVYASIAASTSRRRACVLPGRWADRGDRPLAGNDRGDAQRYRFRGYGRRRD